MEKGKNREDPDVYTITIEDVKKTAEEFGCIVVHLPERGMVIVMDDTIMGSGFIKNFGDNPDGLLRARRYAVRQDERDEESEQSFEDLRAEHLKEIESP
jgi:hypothetical protein